MILMLVHPTFKVEIDQPITHLEYLSIKELLEKTFGYKETSTASFKIDSSNNPMNQFFGIPTPNIGDPMQQQPNINPNPNVSPTSSSNPTNTITFNTLNRFRIIIKAEIKANDLY